MPPLRGFVLQPTYKLEAGRPVVQLHGKLEDGARFLVRHRREAPREGDPVARVEVEAPADVPLLRARLHRDGITCYEADVRFAMRYLIDRGIRGSLSIEGDGRPG